VSPSRSRWNIRGIQSRVGLLVVLGVVTSMVVPGWIAWKSLSSLAIRFLLGRLSVATAAASHLNDVVAREWSKLQDVATGPGHHSLNEDVEGRIQSSRAADVLPPRRAQCTRPMSPDADGRVRLREPEAALRMPLSCRGARGAAWRPSTATAGERSERTAVFLSSRSATGLDRAPGWRPA